MTRSTIRLTLAQAPVRHLCAQFNVIDSQRVPLFAGVFGIVGHGNVTCLSRRWRRCRTSGQHGAARTNYLWHWPPSVLPTPISGVRS